MKYSNFMLLLSVMLTLASFVLGGQTNPGCGTNFNEVTIGNVKFPQTIQPVTWEFARTVCRLCFGGLADINNTLVQSQLNQPGGERWIGSYNGGLEVTNLVWFTSTGVIVPVFDGQSRQALCLPADEPPLPPAPSPGTPTPPPAPTPRTPECTPTTINFGGQDFFLLPQFYNWIEANSTCWECYRTEMANIFNSVLMTPNLNQTLFQIGRYQGGAYTPGLTLDARSGSIVFLTDYDDPGTRRPSVCNIPLGQ